MPRSEWKTLKNFKIIIPSFDVFTSFNEIILPIFQKVLLKSCENKTMSEIRDSLLPKLMSGKIRVPVEAE